MLRNRMTEKALKRANFTYYCLTFLEGCYIAMFCNDDAVLAIDYDQSLCSQSVQSGLCGKAWRLELQRPIYEERAVIDVSQGREESKGCGGI